MRVHRENTKRKKKKTSKQTAQKNYHHHGGSDRIAECSIIEYALSMEHHFQLDFWLYSYFFCVCTDILRFGVSDRNTSSNQKWEVNEIKKKPYGERFFAAHSLGPFRWCSIHIHIGYLRTDGWMLGNLSTRRINGSSESCGCDTTIRHGFCCCCCYTMSANAAWRNSRHDDCDWTGWLFSEMLINNLFVQSDISEGK